MVALASPKAAFAGGDWDWDQEFEARHWRTATLIWARDIHPDHPSFAMLLEEYDPPAEELWCHDPGTPDPIDLDIHSDLLVDWLYDYLELPPNMQLPPNMPAWPPECME